MLPTPPDAPPPRRYGPLVAGAVVIALVAGLVVWQGELFKTGMLAAMDGVRAAGPGWFFAAMSVLPSFGFPLLPFALAAGPVFGERLGTGGVVVCALVAVACNVSLSYLIAARFLRPWTARLLARWGYGDVLERRRDFGWRWVLFVRLAPGLPFFVQSYLLGLTRAQFAPYVVISTVVPGVAIAGTVWFGDTLWRAHGREALWSIGVVIAVVLLLGWMRRRARAGARS